jgi:hypothetical protein
VPGQSAPSGVLVEHVAAVAKLPSIQLKAIIIPTARKNGKDITINKWSNLFIDGWETSYENFLFEILWHEEKRGAPQRFLLSVKESKALHANPKGNVFIANWL